MIRVIIESPYGSLNEDTIKRNEIYCEFCMRDSLINYNESPYASHLLYTRKYVLNDNNTAERKIGINAGFLWRQVCNYTVFYTDLGLTNGMKFGRMDCVKNKISFVYRKLNRELWELFIEICKSENLEISN